MVSRNLDTTVRKNDFTRKRLLKYIEREENKAKPNQIILRKLKSQLNVLRVADRGVKKPDIYTDKNKFTDLDEKKFKSLTARLTSDTKRAVPKIAKRDRNRQIQNRERGASTAARNIVREAREKASKDNKRAGLMVPIRRYSEETPAKYAEAFASPDADKMYTLSEKNRRKDMNMLERAFDSIKLAGDRATAERRKLGLGDYDFLNDRLYGASMQELNTNMRKGGRLKNKKTSSTRKRPAQKGFGVETRGN